MPKHVGAHVQQFDTGDTVLVRDYREGRKWTKGRISFKTGPLSYEVDIGNGTIWRRHVDQMHPCDSSAFHDNAPTRPPVYIDLPAVTIPPKNHTTGDATPAPETKTVAIPGPPIDLSTPKSPQPRRYPERIRKPPKRMDL